MTTNITVFTAGPMCIACTLVKNLLARSRIVFNERNMKTDPTAAELLLVLGYHDVPVVMRHEQLIWAYQEMVSYDDTEAPPDVRAAAVENSLAAALRTAHMLL